MKALRTTIIVILVLVIIPLLGFGIWFIQRGENLEIFVVNKSMVDFKGSENMALNYILNSEKILTSGNRAYNLTTDHYGVIWSKDAYEVKYPRLKELKRTAEKADMVYYADVSGIWKSQAGSLREGEEDLVEYGGLNNTDYTLIRYAMELDKPLLLECSFYGLATEPLVRYNIEKLTDVYYVGWIGKAVKDLAEEADLTCGFDYRKAYEETNETPWDATGPGIVMVNPEARRVVILRDGEDVDISDGIIYTPEEHAEAFNLPEAVNYKGWFTVLHPGRNEVISSFMLKPTDAGSEKLKENGLPAEFPALINGNGDFYFMAGDFGKSKVSLVFSRVVGVRELLDLMRSSAGKNPDNFFFSYYKPFITGILDEAREVGE